MYWNNSFAEFLQNASIFFNISIWTTCIFKYVNKYTYKYILIKRPLSQAPQVIDGQKRRNSDQGRQAGGKLRLLLLLKFRIFVSLVRINTNIEKQNEILLQICIQIQTVIKAGKQEGNSCRFFFWNFEFFVFV